MTPVYSCKEFMPAQEVFSLYGTSTTVVSLAVMGFKPVTFQSQDGLFNERDNLFLWLCMFSYPVMKSNCNSFSSFLQNAKQLNAGLPNCCCWCKTCDATNKIPFPAVYSRFICHHWHYWSSFKEHKWKNCLQKKASMHTIHVFVDSYLSIRTI